MKEKFLVAESKRIHKATRKRLLICSIIAICSLTFLYFALKDELDMQKEVDKMIMIVGIILVVILVLADVIGLLRTRKADTHGENLILPFAEGTKEEIVEKINREADEAILYEEYISEFPEGKTPHGEKVVLTASYLLLCNTKVTAIPRDKIYWVCAQVGYKGGPFRVRFLVFTQKKLFEIVGVDIPHVEALAEHLYAYIPNIFPGIDDFTFTYRIEELYTNDRYQFLRLYEEALKQYIAEKDTIDNENTEKDILDNANHA